MSAEKELQKRLVKWLKSQGCFVMTITVVPGVPQGTPDVFFCKEGFYGFAEVKANKKSKYQPLQKERIAKLMDWSWAKVVYPENWEDIREELEGIL